MECDKYALPSFRECVRFISSFKPIPDEMHLDSIQPVFYTAIVPGSTKSSEVIEQCVSFVPFAHTGERSSEKLCKNYFD